MGDLSYAQYAVLRVTGLIASLLSIGGSSLIILSICRLGAGERRLTLHQLLLGLSTADIVATLAIATAPFMVPQGHSEAHWWAVGSPATCSAGGFIYVTFATAASFYNMFISMHFWMTVHGRKMGSLSSRSQAKGRRFKYLAHITSMSVPLAFGVAGLVTHSFHLHPYLDFCYFAESSHGCDGDPGEICHDAQTAITIGHVRTAIISIVAIISIYCTLSLTRKVQRNLGRSSQYSPRRLSRTYSDVTSSEHSADTLRSSEGPSQSSQDSRQREVAIQSLLYTLAYLNSFVFVVFRALAFNFTNAADNKGDPGWFLFLLCHWFFVPLQGLLNFTTFVRPKYQAWKAHLRKQRQLQMPRISEDNYDAYRSGEDNSVTSNMDNSHRSRDLPKLPPFWVILQKAVLEEVPSSRRRRRRGGRRPFPANKSNSTHAMAAQQRCSTSEGHQSTPCKGIAFQVRSVSAIPDPVVIEEELNCSPTTVSSTCRVSVDDLEVNFERLRLDTIPGPTLHERGPLEEGKEEMEARVDDEIVGTCNDAGIDNFEDVEVDA